MLMPVRICGQTNVDGSECRRPVGSRGSCGVDHTAGAAPLPPAGSPGPAASPGPDPFAGGGSLYDPAGLPVGELVRRVEVAVAGRQPAARAGGPGAAVSGVVYRQGVEALRDPRCPPRMLRAAYKTGDVQLARAALSNPRCPRLLLVRHLAETGERAEVAAHPRAPRLLLAWWADQAIRSGGRSGGFGVVAALAANPRTPPRSLGRLAAAGDGSTAERVLENPSCPAKTADRLAWSTDIRVAAAAVAHPKCPPFTVGEVASRSVTGRVRAAAAANPNCPPGVLAGLAGDPDPEVRAAAAANPNCPSAARAHAGLLAD